MRFAAQMASQQKNLGNRYKAWNAPALKPPILQELLKEALHNIKLTVPRVFRATNHLRYLLKTDASDLGWGATLEIQGRVIKSLKMGWTKNQSSLHSNHKESLAMILALTFLLPFIHAGTRLELKTNSL